MTDRLTTTPPAEPATAEQACPTPASQRRRKRGSGQKQYSDRELVECLRTASKELGGVLSTTSYAEYIRGRIMRDRRSWPSHQAHQLRFGSWRKALLRAGLRANRSSPIADQFLFSSEHCTDAIQHLAREIGHAPTAYEYEQAAKASNGAMPSQATVRNRCGTWLGALRLAGF